MNQKTYKDYREELISAADLLKKNCERGYKRYVEIGECDCLFWENEECSLVNFMEIRCPKDFDVPKKLRWTKDDVELAKKLMDFGVIEIGRNWNEYDKIWLDDKGNSGTLPSDSFQGLGVNEFINIRQVIEEWHEYSGEQEDND